MRRIKSKVEKYTKEGSVNIEMRARYLESQVDELSHELTRWRVVCVAAMLACGLLIAALLLKAGAA